MSVPCDKIIIIIIIYINEISRDEIKKWFTT